MTCANSIETNVHFQVQTFEYFRPVEYGLPDNF